MHKMPKKIAETFTNTFDGKCAIIISVGASKGFSMPFYYTYIYKKKAAVPTEQPLFWRQKIFILNIFHNFFRGGTQSSLAGRGGLGGLTDGGDITLDLGLGAGGTDDQTRATL